MSTTESSYTRCMALAIMTLGVFVYANTFNSEFLWDDVSSVLLHQSVQDSDSPLKLFTEDQHAYAGGQGNFYRPLLALTFLVDFWLSNDGPTINDGDNAIPDVSPLLFHIDSLVWHCLAALFFMLLLGNLKAPRVVQTLVPMLYVVHPLHTEAVSYISGRADSMSATFIFAGLFFATRPRVWRNTILVIMCYIAGLLSKESSLIFPGLLLFVFYAYNKIEERNWHRQQWLALGGTLLTLVTYALLRSIGPLNFGSDSQPPTSTFGERIAETLQSFAYYMQLLFSPQHLHMERTLSDATTTTTLLGLAALVIILAITVFAFKKRHHRMVLATLWFLLTWLPISGIFPLNAPMAEHWMYVPMAGFLWALLEMLLCILPDSLSPASQGFMKKSMVALSVVWLISLSFNSIQRNVAWSSNTAIYSATIAENPNTKRVHYNLAVTYQDMENNNVGAIRHYQQVLDLYATKKKQDPSQEDIYWDEEIESHFSLAQIFYDEQNYTESIKHYVVLANLVPEGKNRSIVGLSFYGMSQCYLKFGNREQAQAMFQEAIKIYPELAQSS